VMFGDDVDFLARGLSSALWSHFGIALSTALFLKLWAFCSL